MGDIWECPFLPGKYFTPSLRSLEDKLHIFPSLCNILYILLGTATTHAPALPAFSGATCFHSLRSGSYVSTALKYLEPSYPPMAYNLSPKQHTPTASLHFIIDPTIVHWSVLGSYRSTDSNCLQESWLAGASCPPMAYRKLPSTVTPTPETFE